MVEEGNLKVVVVVDTCLSVDGWLLLVSTVFVLSPENLRKVRLRKEMCLLVKVLMVASSAGLMVIVAALLQRC